MQKTQWLDDGFIWTDYDDNVQQQIEKAFRSKKKALTITCRGQNYRLDFDQMTQTNTATDYIRRIRQLKHANELEKEEKFTCDQFEDFTFMTDAECANLIRENETCPTCLDDFKPGQRLIKLNKCQKCIYHYSCPVSVLEYIQNAGKCPLCQKYYLPVSGNMPPGQITRRIIDENLPGYEDCKTIHFVFYFPSGIQSKKHPNPGHSYEGTERDAFLPDNEQGRKIAQLFELAFQRKLLFTIGYSLTRGRNNVVIFNGVHLKTDIVGPYGYPDETYLARVEEELKQKGIVL